MSNHHSADALKQTAREVIEALAKLDNSKRPGGGVHGQVVGMEPYVIRANGDALACLYEAQALLDQLLDPFDRRPTPAVSPDLAELRKLAEAATPGPWELIPVMQGGINHLCPVGPDGMSLLTVVHQGDTPFGAVYNDTDAALIAAASPGTILALLDRIERAEAVPVEEVGELDFDAALVKKITDAYAARFPVPAGYSANEVAGEVVRLIGEAPDVAGEAFRTDDGLIGDYRNVVRQRDRLLRMLDSRPDANSVLPAFVDWTRAVEKEREAILVAAPVGENVGTQ